MTLAADVITVTSGDLAGLSARGADAVGSLASASGAPNSQTALGTFLTDALTQLIASDMQSSVQALAMTMAKISPTNSDAKTALGAVATEATRIAALLP